MKIFEQIVKYGALVYTLLAFLQVSLMPIVFNIDIDNYFFPFGFIFLLLHFVKNRSNRKIVIGFLMLFIWGIIAEYLHKGHLNLTSIAYLMYFIKWPILLFTVFEFTQNHISNLHLGRILDVFFLSLAGLNIIMIINPFGIGEMLQFAYAPKAYTNFIYYHEPGVYRLAGTQMNPNDNAVLFCLFFIYYSLVRPERWFLLILCFCLILFTQSRTVFLLTAFLAILYLYSLLKRRLNRKKLLFISVSVLALVTFIVVSSENLRSIFTGQAFVSGSVKRRLENFSQMNENDFNSTILGNGVVSDPVKELGTYIDSEFIALLFQFGIVGLILWGVLIYFLSVRFEYKSIQGKYWMSILFMILVVSLTNFSFLHGSIGVMLSVFLGLQFYDLELNKSVNR